MRVFQNYHRHSMYTNARVSDSVVRNEDYAKRAVELGHGIISTLEHGFQGRYVEGYELAKKHNLKFVFGTEAYWVKDRLESDDTNSHICIFAKTENARQCINDILSEANITGFYYRPRIDLDLILSLPKDEVIITTACVAFWKYEDIDDIVLKLNEHFTHFFLEVQYHNVELQKNLNKHILELSQQYNIPIIMGCDSHYIDNSTAWERDDFLTSRHMSYSDEQSWYMDYPDGDIAYQRFLEQGVLSEQQINEAMDNTNIFLMVEEYNSPIFNKEIKMPTLYPGLTQKQIDKIYGDLIKEKWNEEKEKIPTELHERYKAEITKEVNDVITTKHSDYFLLDYRLVKRAIEKGGMITNSGRGSGVSYYTNKLLGFTKIDRIAAKVKMYPERFMSPTRILESKSLADLDLNTGNPEVFAGAQTDVFVEVYGDAGKEFSYPMMAYGTFKPQSAFKMFARAKGLDFELANTISQQIKEYEKALKYAEDDEKDDIDLYDFVDEQYHKILKDSEQYLGIISDIKPHPCGYLIYQGNIRREIGLIKIKSESTGKERICTVMDGKWAEDYKFLKNDLLKVDVVKLIKLAYKRLGLEEHDEQELVSICNGNQKVWDIYKNGWVMGINQVEKSATKHKVMKYQPLNISESCAFVAAIRPGFKSMYNIFENREPYTYDIPAFDKLIQTDEMPNSFLLYQEMAMAALNFAGISMSECYEVIKNIAKKREEKVKKYKDQFMTGFKERLIEIEKISEEAAQEATEKVWQIIDDSCRYSFNASHSYSVAIDSLYGAYLKSHYPLHFYEVFLNLLHEKGNSKDRISLVKQEASKAFNIKFTPMRLGQDNRHFTLDEKNNVIYSALSSIKDMGYKVAHELYELGKNEYSCFTDLMLDIKYKTSCDKSQLAILIKLGYFNKFGKNKKLLKIAEYFDTRYKKNHIDKTKIKRIEEVKEFESNCPEESLSIVEQLKAEFEAYGQPISTYKCDLTYGFIMEMDEKYTPKLQIYKLATGEIEEYKVYKKIFYSEVNADSTDSEALIQFYDVINIGKTADREKTTKNPSPTCKEDEWIPTGELEKVMFSWTLIKRLKTE